MWIIIGILLMLNVIQAICGNYNKVKGILIFNIIWTVVLFLSGLNIYNIFNVDYYTYFILIVGILSFNIGTMCYRKRKLIKINKFKIKKIYLKLFFWHQLISLVINLKLLLRILPKIQQYGYKYVKGANYRIEGFEATFSSTKIQMLYELGIGVIGDVIGYIIIINYLKNKNKKNLILVVLYILNKIITVAFSGSKSPLIWLFLFILLSLYYYDEIKKKYIILSLSLIIIFFLTLYFSGMNIFKSIIIYATGSIVAFDKFINSNFDLWYGKLFIAPFEYPITILLRFFSKDFFPIADYYSKMRSEFFYINENIKFNALYTFFDVPYLDFKLLGILLYSLILGLLYKYCISTCYKNPIKRLIIIRFDILLFYTILKNHFIYFDNLFFIILLVIFSNKILEKERM